MDIPKEEMYKDKVPWYRYITVEPVMFCYMMAFMITNVTEQTFYIFKACTVNHNYTADVCYNISNNPAINQEVQMTVTRFHQWNGVASHMVPLLLAFFLGSYSDKRGRKFILLAGLVGKLYFSIMITVNTMFAWPLQYVVYTASLPSALTGADLAIFAACFAYIADVTSLADRTLRVAILDVVYLSAMPSGIAIGSVLYSGVVDRSFTAMFAINSALMAVATVYAYVFLAWQTAPDQKSLKAAGVTNPLADLLDWTNVTNTLNTLLKKRSSSRRLLLWLLLLSMAFYTFQRDERPMMYMYTTQVFQWDETTYSHFRTYLSVLYVFTMLVGVPLMTKVLRWRDTRIVMVGTCAHMAGHALYAQATADALMYAGATAAALGPCVAPLLRSMTSKVLPPGERGVAYTFLSVMENAVAMFASVLYGQLYQATFSSYINAIFYLTIFTQAVVFFFAVTMEILLQGRKLEGIADQDEKCISE